MISEGQRVAAGRLLMLLLMLAVVWLWPLWKVFWGRPLPSRASAMVSYHRRCGSLGGDAARMMCAALRLEPKAL